MASWITRAPQKTAMVTALLRGLHSLTLNDDSARTLYLQLSVWTWTDPWIPLSTNLPGRGVIESKDFVWSSSFLPFKLPFGNSSNTLRPWAHSQQHSPSVGARTHSHHGTHSPCNALLPHRLVDLWRTFVLVVWLSKGLSSDSGEQVLCKMIWKFPAPHSPWQSASYSGFTWCSGTERETLQIG